MLALMLLDSVRTCSSAVVSWSFFENDKQIIAAADGTVKIHIPEDPVRRINSLEE